jgi:3-hydroxyisobutyrate dehydrogenase-like beta-hydroxyacid dehydrogenase
VTAAPTVAVIATGAMGAAIGARLTDSGARVISLLDGRSEASRKRAADAGIINATEAEVAACDFVLSVVPPGEAVALARRLLPALTAAKRKPLYADCNAISPQTMQEIVDLLRPTGCDVVDGGIIGPPPKAGSNATRLYVSGPASERLAQLRGYGLAVEVMGGKTGSKTGDASALKMCYGAFNKGVTALGAAVILAAEREGVAAALNREWQLSQAPLLGKLERGIPDMFPKAYRWVAEFEEVAAFVGPGSERQMFDAIARLYERLAADVAGARTETAALGSFFRKGESEPRR